MHAEKAELQLVITADGSPTLYRPDLNEHYHSVKGAVTESLHVFISEGFNFVTQAELNILEVGLGTALNAALTSETALEQGRKVNYTALEPNPPEEGIISLYLESMKTSGMPAETMNLIHRAEWGKAQQLNPAFSIKKIAVTLQQFQSEAPFDLIYYDAFAPSRQSELWTLEMMQKLFALTKPGGVLVTYCAQGDFRRNLKAAGFKVKRRKGPPGGKWQMTRAIRAAN